MEETRIRHWKEFLPDCQYCTGGVSFYLVSTALAKQAVVYQMRSWFDIKKGVLPVELEEFSEQIVAIGGLELVTSGACHKLFVWDCAALDIKVNDESKREVTFSWTANTDDLSKKLTDLCNTLFPIEPKGSVYILIPSENKLITKSIGVGSVPMEPENYRPEAIVGFNKVTKDLQEPNPLGRLAIFDGPPGTGKTYMVRALLAALPKLKFLILPSNMVDSLSGPQLLSVLIDETDSNDKPSLPGLEHQGERKTLVLVIEDADRCLSKRGSDNLSSLSNLLNLSDGIIGTLLDLRIICTTNAEVADIDSAILRTGRLSARVEVGLLGAEQAKTIYARIGGVEPQTWDKKFYALSDVYAMAKGLDSKETESGAPKRKIGF